MLQLEWYDGVHDPIEAQYGIDTDGGVVPPYLLVSEFLAQKAVFSVRVAETPVIVDVPERRVDAVDSSERDEDSSSRRPLINAVDAKGGVEHDGREILAEIEQMREFVACVGVTAQTLQSAPDAGEGGHEADDAHVRGVAGARVGPVARVEAEEGGHVLRSSVCTIER